MSKKAIGLVILGVVVGVVLASICFSTAKRLFGVDLEMPNPNFSTINNLDSIECQPLASAEAKVGDNIDKYTSARADDIRGDKWLNKWIAVRGGKIYLGTISSDNDHYINFGDVFNIVDQKDVNVLLGSGLNPTDATSTYDAYNVGFTTLMLDKTKGILSVSTNGSSGGNGEYLKDRDVYGYSAVYNCKEVPLSTLNGSRGLPE